MSPVVDYGEICVLAQNLARNCGYHVFPCKSDPDNPERDKVPATPRGFKDASRDAGAIAELWRKYPGDLIGIATGEPSDVDVLDIDVKHEQALAWWNVASKKVPETRTYRTRSGGLHAYFKHADGIRNTQSKLALGVDTRGTGGYAIHWFAAGFECLNHAPPAAWPDWLRDCVLWKPEPPLVNVARISDPLHADKAIEGVLRTISGAREGERNAVLFWGASRIGERIKLGQIGQAEATALLIASARAIGLQDLEANRTITSAWRA